MQRARILLVIIAVTVFYALATGFPFFHRMYYILSLLLVAGFAWAWLLVHGTEVEARRPVLRTRAGQSITEKVLVRRRSRYIRGFIEVREGTDMPGEAPGAVLSLEGDEPPPLEIEVTCPYRGVYRLGPTRVEGSDPFGLFRLRRSMGAPQRLVVHPATVDLPGFVLLPADLPGEGPVHLRTPHVTTSAYTIRDYLAGDSFNRIAWKSTVRHQRLMVKEFEMEPANNIWVLTDMQRKANAGAAGRAIEETAVAAAASIAKRYVDGGHPVGLLTEGDQRVSISPERGSDHLLRLLDVLAEVRAHGSTSLLDLIGHFHVQAGRYTSVAIVTASPDAEWLDGVRYLLHRRSRVSIVVVDGDPARADFPSVAREAAALRVPTYVIKAGAGPPGAIVALTPPALSREPAVRRPVLSRV